MSVSLLSIRNLIYSEDFDFDVFVSMISSYIDADFSDDLRSDDKKGDLFNVVENALRKANVTLEEDIEPLKDTGEELTKEPVEEKPKIKLKPFNQEEPIEEVKEEPIEEIKEEPIEEIKEEPIAKRFADRKSHIIHLAKESAYKLKDIVEIMDDSWGYKAKGTTSKTRVAKTIKELKENNLIYIDSDDVIRWR